MRMVVNGFLAIAVMAFAGTASAATYDIQNGNIISIGNLELNFDNDELDGFYNITFVTDTGVDQYGAADDPTFDFVSAENGVTALPQITSALNAAPETVTGASATGSDIFFIPLLRIPIIGIGTVWAAVGAENVSGTWGDCKNDCLVGVRPLGPADVNTYARVTVVPEPGTALLLGLGLAGLGATRRSRRQATGDETA
jgi:hypothetical protein